ncbi:hypothetical protein B0H12DRAFT_1243677 [Mycena haematopus]|nr:hypothetical protein B0H12DRAFT_1243677 [Mycena haematopus]
MPQVVVLDDDAFSRLQEILQSAFTPSDPSEAYIVSSLQASFAAAVPAPSTRNSTTVTSLSTRRVALPTTRLHATSTESTRPGLSRVDSRPLSRLGRSLSLPPTEQLAFADIPDVQLWAPIVIPPLMQRPPTVATTRMESTTEATLLLSPLTPLSSLSPLPSPSLSFLGSPTLAPLSSPSRSSPTLNGSPFSNSNGKRQLPAHSEAPPAKKLTIRVPVLSKVQEQTRNGADAGGGGGGGGGGGNARCPKKGDQTRVGGDDDIGVMDCDDPRCARCGDANADATRNGERERYNDVDGESEVGEESEAAHGKKKKGSGKGKKNTSKGYTTTGSGAPLTKDAGTLLGEMSGSFYWTYRFASIREDAAKKFMRKRGVESIGEDYGYAPSTFYRRVQAGTRLLSLCAASTPYILVIIAVTNMELDLTDNKKATNVDIMGLCIALREITHDKWDALVKRLRIPLGYIQQKSTFLSNVDFVYNVPQPIGQPELIEYITFDNLSETDSLFGKITTNYPNLPPRSPDWQVPVVPWNIFSDVKDLPLPDVRVIKMCKDFVKPPCPVNRHNTEAFTTKEREAADSADLANDLDDLERKNTNRKQYIEVNTSILNR